MTESTRELYERERELTRLTDLVDLGCRSRGSVTIIEGPAGIGKSSLIRRLKAECGGTPVRVLVAQSSELNAELGFGVAVQLLGPAVSEALSRPGPDPFEGGAEAVRQLFGATRSGQPEPDDPNFDPTVVALYGLERLVVNLASQHPLVLAVDDAHWADPASLRFLELLARHVSELPVVLIITLRSGEPGTSAALVEQVRHLPDAERIVPAPLGAESVSTMVRETFPQASSSFSSACVELTGGNPLYVEALLRAAEEERVDPNGDGIGALRGLAPEVLRRRLTGLLAGMPSEEASLAKAATVLGEGTELHQLARTATVPMDDARDAAEALLERGIFKSAERPGFSHPIVRETIYAAIGEAERAALHLSAATVLREDQAGTEPVANQLLFAQAGRQGWVVDTLFEASANARRMGAPESSSVFLDRALREGGGLERRAEILFELGLAEATVGAPRGMELISAAASELDDPDQRAMALMNLARILGIRGRYAASAGAFRQASEVLAGTGSELAWWAEAGQAASGSHDPGSRREAQAKLQELLTRTGLEDLPIGRTVLGFAALERIYSARPREEALALANRVTQRPPEDVETDGVAYRIAAMTFAMCGELEASERLADSLEHLARSQGSAMEIAAVAYPRMLVAAERGQIDDLSRRASDSLEGSRFGWGIGASTAAAMLAVAMLEADKPADAARALVSAGGEVDFEGTLMFPVWLEARGVLALAAGELDRALVDFERAGELRAESQLESPVLSWLGWRSGAALARAGLGEPEPAMALAREELALAERSGIARVIGNARRTLGLVTAGGPDIAVLADAVRVHEDSASRLELARSLIELAAALRRTGRRRESRTPLRRGLQLARLCGSTRLETQAQEELRASGARLGRPALSGIAALTPSELRVCRLAAAGLSNPQIATRLYLSRKTVEHHLGRSYRKLGIDSREDLPDAVGSTGSGRSDEVLINAPGPPRQRSRDRAR